MLFWNSSFRSQAFWMAIISMTTERLCMCLHLLSILANLLLHMCVCWCCLTLGVSCYLAQGWFNAVTQFPVSPTPPMPIISVTADHFCTVLNLSTIFADVLPCRPALMLACVLLLRAH